jgi:putative ABC transport system substrate-binding protein
VDRLGQLGWIQAENLSIEWRFADAQVDLLPQLAADLIHLPIEVLVTTGTASALAAHQQTTTIPIVLNSVGDPAVSELVKNLARPIGNVTGLTLGSATVSIKSVELLRTVLPQLTRLAIFGDPTFLATPTESYAAIVTPSIQVAQTLGLQVNLLEVSKLEDVDAAIEVAKAWGAEALLIPAMAPYVGAVIARTCVVAAENRLPTMFTPDRVAVMEQGGLMDFEANQIAEYRLIAEYVDKILRGVAPADLPVEEPRQFDFIVNVKTAQALGITIPPDAAAQVTQWIQ